MITTTTIKTYHGLIFACFFWCMVQYCTYVYESLYSIVNILLLLQHFSIMSLPSLLTRALLSYFYTEFFSFLEQILCVQCVNVSILLFACNQPRNWVTQADLQVCSWQKKILFCAALSYVLPALVSVTIDALINCDNGYWCFYQTFYLNVPF